ncbi:hypothetical protein FNB79_08795 [Formosa sediminum]|uniref:Uncharacterized protein n=1 Tax=Formosa sediminum TaxID=2594004 RepID=A0A516GRC7_9FLAO|nr:hypothetical protein [Formosa sediminum]QDO94072.1 hypothetical protein FNB79_08795 [Formosa sediminum]
MKKVFFFAGVFMLGFSANALTVNPAPVSVGDVVTVGVPSQFAYSSINFPKSNFIIKRGGVVNYNNLAGLQVEIVSITDKKDGSREAVIKRADGRKFFKVLSTVSVAIDEAVETHELLLESKQFTLD